MHTTPGTRRQRTYPDVEPTLPRSRWRTARREAGIVGGAVALVAVAGGVHLAGYRTYHSHVGFVPEADSPVATWDMPLVLCAMVVQAVFRGVEVQKAVLSGTVTFAGCCWALLWLLPQVSSEAATSFMACSAGSCIVAVNAAVTLRSDRPAPGPPTED